MLASLEMDGDEIVKIVLNIEQAVDETLIVAASSSFIAN